MSSFTEPPARAVSTLQVEFRGGSRCRGSSSLVWGSWAWCPGFWEPLCTLERYLFSSCMQMRCQVPITSPFAPELLD